MNPKIQQHEGRMLQLQQVVPRVFIAIQSRARQVANECEKLHAEAPNTLLIIRRQQEKCWRQDTEEDARS